MKEEKEIVLSEPSIPVEYIRDTINPKTVLVIGKNVCDIVNVLRGIDIDAYGIVAEKDSSDSDGSESLKYCYKGSVFGKLPREVPKSYSMVLVTDFSELVKDCDEKKLMNKLCSLSDRLLLPLKSGIAGVDIASGLSGKKYFKDVFRTVPTEYSLDFVFYTKKPCSVEEICHDYEFLFEQQKETVYRLNNANNKSLKAIEELKEKVEKLEQEKMNLSSRLDNANFELSTFQKHIEIQTGKLQKLSSDFYRYRDAFLAVTNSRFWRFMQPFRTVSGKMKKILLRNKITRFMVTALFSVKRNGLKNTTRGYYHHAMQDIAGRKYIKNNIPSAEQLKKERDEKFARNVKISVIVPLYNTPVKFLEEMIQSVIDQSYVNWELCMADGSDKDHPEVEEKVKQFTAQDNRILYKKLPENLGIADNSNECLKMVTGDYVALFDHDDILHPSAFYEAVKVINEKNADFIYTDEASFKEVIANTVSHHFKPDFSPDTLRSYNYICHLSVFSKKLLDQVGMFSKECEGSQDYDLVLRLTEKAKNIVHIPRILYYWRIHALSVANNIDAKPYCIEAAKKAIGAHLNRLSLEAKVGDSVVPTTYKVDYLIKGKPLVSIVIPNKDHIEDLRKCILSITDKSSYDNYEIVVIENNSEKKETFDYYKILEKNDNIRVLMYKDEFNYSKINNFGVEQCRGEYILLLNNDMEVITPQWIEEMLMFAQRKDVGAVGAKLLYPDGSIQHAGVILGINGVAGHSHKGFHKNDPGYAARITIAQNLSAVTAACLMTRREVFWQVNGLDPIFAVAFNDIDFCLRIRDEGYNIVYTPYAQLYHYESKSRGYEDTKEKQKRFEGEVHTLQKRWRKILSDGDPYYNKNLTLKYEDFSIKI